MDTINVPGLGRQKKGWVLAIGGITAGIVGYAWLRHRSTGSAAAAAAAPGAPDPNAIDPATGLTYAAEGGQAGGVYGYGYNPFGGALDASGNPVGAPAPVPITTQQFTTNGQWAQAAEEYLVNTAGADPTTVAAALGKYITGQPLTSGQQGVVSSAIAFEGYPPVAGPGGSPPSMKVTTAPPPPAPPPPGAHKPPPPRKPPAPRQAHITTDGTLTWDQTADRYVHRQHPIYWLDTWNPAKAAVHHGTGKKLPRGMTLRVA